MNTIRERIQRVMGAVFDVTPEEITEQASPGTVEQWDSLRQINLIVALEEEFEVRFPEDTLEQLISLQLIELSLRDLGVAD